MTKKNSSSKPLRVGLISLGCAKNLVDAEIMLGSLLKSGAEITNDAAQADAVIVNTCSFIDSAQEESVDTILESVELRDAKQPHWTGSSNSPGTFGHFGGSGTFVWVDPEADLALACLTDLDFGPWALEAWPRLADAVLISR